MVRAAPDPTRAPIRERLPGAGSRALRGRLGRGWRPAVGVVILAVLLAVVGIEPVVLAVTEVTWPALLAALALTVVTTICAAWRWSVVATGLGARIALPAAVAAYYRSQFLNSVLPGGVLGDVHRAVRHGYDVDRMGRGVRSVVWERSLAQVVQVVLTAALLVVLPGPVRALVVIGAAALVALVLGVTLVRVVGVLVADLRRILRVRGAPVGIVVTSVVAVLGHVTVLLVAMAAAGVEVSVGRQVALALIVLLGAAIPASVAGWGPREGVAAWAFEVAGLGAATGVSVAVLYGVLALVATLPGAVLLVAGTRSSRPGSRRAARPEARVVP
ncbi:lysylphosphatidylglycerol synthase transmembrane domain-containing protein [Janibacter alittae]|uniref:Lysylphosphatidylglycerol synthase transmembrane domain-containing protein n=1 Tax=Janibacter alittae TaxID=3115209 RepID=A0ABZ2MKY9_9MICO